MLSNGDGDTYDKSSLPCVDHIPSCRPTRQLTNSRTIVSGGNGNEIHCFLELQIYIMDLLIGVLSSLIMLL